MDYTAVGSIIGAYKHFPAFLCAFQISGLQIANLLKQSKQSSLPPVDRWALQLRLIVDQ